MPSSSTFSPDRGAIPIAIFLTSFEPGGTERQMIELMRRLDPARWAVHLACTRAQGPWFARASEAAASVGEFPLQSFRSLGAARELWAFARWCRARRIAVVQTTELYSNIFGLPGAALGGVPVRIGSRREINPDKTTGQIAAQRAAYTFAHKIVTNSRAGAMRLRRERVPQSKVTIVPNGLDVHSSAPRTARTPVRQVIVVANLRPEKGHDVLVDAAPFVLQRFPDARFEVVGAGPGRDAILERVRARQVSHAFSFRGHCDDVPARLAEADIFVLPSRSEAFPNALLEAMAGGLPVVASAVGGILEIIDHDRTGLLVEAGNHPQLAHSLCALMADPARSRQLGDSARAEVLARFSFDRMVRAFESVYLHELTCRGVIGAGAPQLAAS